MSDERLEALGIHVVLDEDHPDLRAECIRIARRLRHQGAKVIGMLPTADYVAVPPIAVQLGLALADVSGATVAFVDANLRWPAISQIADDDPSSASRAERGEEPPTRPRRGGRPFDDAFATRWLRGSLALLTPPKAAAAGAGVPQLARVIQGSFELFAHMLVDLTGFRKLGEHLAAIEMCDGVIVLGRAGRTTESELLRVKHELPPALQLGVLLVG